MTWSIDTTEPLDKVFERIVDNAYHCRCSRGFLTADSEEEGKAIIAAELTDILGQFDELPRHSSTQNGAPILATESASFIRPIFVISVEDDLLPLPTRFVRQSSRKNITKQAG
jgi:hypothetical protein